MNIKSKSLSLIIFCALTSITPLALSMHHTDRAEEAAEEGIPFKKEGETRYHFHAHNYMMNGNNASVESLEHAMTLKELLYLGAQRGVVQGSAQVIASLIVEMTQLGLIKGVQYMTGPNEKQLQEQQQMIAIDQAEKQFQTLLEVIRTSGPMVTTLVEGSTQLNDEEAKKMATLALMKYGAQVTMALEMNNMQLQAIMTGAMPS